MTTPTVTMPTLQLAADEHMFDHSASAISREQQKYEMNQLPAYFARDFSLYSTASRHPESRNFRVNPRCKKNSCPQSTCQNTNAKTNDRVSPMSIIDLPHLQAEEGRRREDIDSLGSVAGDESDSLASGYVELKLLQHPLSDMNATNEGSEHAAGFGCVDGVPFSLSKVALTRTSTPRDCLPTDSWNHDDSLSEILESDDADLAKNSEKDDFKLSEADVVPLTPVFVLGQPEASASVVGRISSIPTSGSVSPLQSAFRKSPPTAHVTVSFNETMEVRYFYRSDDEIAIMKQCAQERRRQQEARRRLRRVRQGMRASASLLRSNKLASMFYHGCTDDGILKGMDQRDILEDGEDNNHEDDDFDGSVFDCGMHFQRHDEQNDTESDDDMPLNAQDEDLNKFAFHGMVDGLSSLINDAIIDVKPITLQNRSNDDIAPVAELLPVNADDEDASDPWFISSLCGRNSTIITLKE